MSPAKETLGIVGKCIYCGESKDNLSEEHILPFALGGNWVLKKASCKKCQDITSSFERDVLHNTLLKVRVKMDFPTRHKDKRPDEFPITYESKKKEKTINLPIRDRPTSLILPIFKKPAFVDKRKYEKGIDIVGTVAYTFPKQSLEKFMLEHGAESVSETVTFKAEGGSCFARLLAKVAYGFSIAQFGLGVIDNNFVLPAILGKIDNIGEWVGSTGKFAPPVMNSHVIELWVKNGIIISNIRLFADFHPKVPEYEIVVGEAPHSTT